MRNFSHKYFRKIQNAHFVFDNSFFLENRVVYEIMWKNMVQPTDNNKEERMRFACWINKAADTHSEYVIIIAFPLQQWLCDLSLNIMLNAHCHVLFNKQFRSELQKQICNQHVQVTLYQT